MLKEQWTKDRQQYRIVWYYVDNQFCEKNHSNECNRVNRGIGSRSIGCIAYGNDKREYSNNAERRFYQKITDIYATSVAYDPTLNISINFFCLNVRTQK